jgi:hypothetical protein
MPLYTIGGRWLPSGVSRNTQRRPEVGTLVAFAHAACRVMHVRDAEQLSEEEEAYLDGMNPIVRARHMPFVITLRREHGPKIEGENSRQEGGLRCGVRFYGFDVYETDRVPLCSCCSDPWPCRLLIAEDQAKKAAVQMEEELKLLPGCCPTCQEPITSRQKTITFPGEYVRNPLAPADPVFHLRSTCRSDAASYEDQWVKADPSRPRSLLTLTCEGKLITCGDGHAECHGAEDCPSVHARHRSMSSCYTQSHGCGRQCGSYSHDCTPSAPAGWPAVPR